MKKKIISILFIALLSVFLISGCTTQQKTTQKVQQPEESPVPTEQPSNNEPAKEIPSPPSIQIKEGESVAPPAPPEN